MTYSDTRHGQAGNRRRENGFTLIEVMIALGILAFGILAIASMQTGSLGGTNLAGNTTESTTVAMNQLEQLIPLPYTSASLAIGDYNPVDTGRYDIRYSVTAGPFSNTRYIKVDVTWSEKGVTKTSSLTYLKMDVI